MKDLHIQPSYEHAHDSRKVSTMSVSFNVNDITTATGVAQADMIAALKPYGAKAFLFKDLQTAAGDVLIDENNAKQGLSEVLAGRDANGKSVTAWRMPDGYTIDMFRRGWRAWDAAGRPSKEAAQRGVGKTTTRKAAAPAPEVLPVTRPVALSAAAYQTAVTGDGGTMPESGTEVLSGLFDAMPVEVRTGRMPTMAAEVLRSIDGATAIKVLAALPADTLGALVGQMDIEAADAMTAARGTAAASVFNVAKHAPWVTSVTDWAVRSETAAQVLSDNGRVDAADAAVYGNKNTAARAIAAIVDGTMAEVLAAEAAERERAAAAEALKNEKVPVTRIIDMLSEPKNREVLDKHGNLELQIVAVMRTWETLDVAASHRVLAELQNKIAAERAADAAAETAARATNENPPAAGRTATKKP